MNEFLTNTDYKIIKTIEEGCSNDKKFFIEDFSGEKYLLRVSDMNEYETKKNEYLILRELDKFGIACSKPISFGICDNEKYVYTLLEWLEGTDLSKVIGQLDEKEQYSQGLKAGKILREIHKLKPEVELSNWSCRYNQVISPRIDAYKSEGVYFEGSEKILEYLEMNEKYLIDRPQCRHHGDYHIGNIILKDNKELGIIDWHTVDFENIGDPWYEFNRIDTKYPSFASGQINGYFDNNVPDAFWRLFAYYLSASAITSIVWAKYYSPEDLEEIMNRNYEVLEWFDNMQNSVPTWFHTTDV